MTASNQNNVDDEPMWEMEELLDHTEEGGDDVNSTQDSTDSDDQTGTTQHDTGPVWDMDELLDDTKTDSSRSSSDSNVIRRSNRNPVVTTLSLFLILGIGAYLLASYSGDSSVSTSKKTTIQERTESDIKTWLQQMDQIATSLSESDINIRSRSLISFSSELQQRDELKSLITYTLDGNFNTFQLTTRDIGSVLQLVESNSKTNEASSAPNTSLEKNKELVRTYREEIETAWETVLKQQEDSSPPSSTTSDNSNSPPGTIDLK